MLKRTVKAIHRLRIYALCFLAIGFFYYLGANPIQVGKYIGARFGSSVGMSTSVPENPFNKLALDLKEKEDRLNQKERDLREREKVLTDAPSQNKLILILGVGTVFLFVLILLNYYFDYRRRKIASGKDVR
ncbi:MAG: hypothetical protein MUC28_04260 [Planctomycetes bacterium]|jgi:hypothetical protein|nr:hypothetical protein [Planctomycetota bacterium]